MSEPVIVVDDAIAHAREAFAQLGRVHPLPGPAISGEALAAVGADALVTRSVTRVDAALLDAAPQLRFVASATAGVDHVELDALRERGVGFANAAGCNANAVCEWVLAAWTRAAPALPSAIVDGPFGVVGFGQVGSRVAALMRRLGYEVLACDPPRARVQTQTQTQMKVEPFVSFDELWRRCTIVSFHVPLIAAGPDATVAYLDDQHPAPGPAKLIINTSRGPVVRDRAFARPDVAAAILDVWDGEPVLAAGRLSDPRLLVASPHVAGYSLEAKLAGTRMAHEALARALGHAPSWTGAAHLPTVELNGPLEGYADPTALMTRVVDLANDDARVRSLAAVPPAARGHQFEALRRGYRLRRELGSWTVSADRFASPEMAAWARLVGFSVQSAAEPPTEPMH